MVGGLSKFDCIGMTSPNPSPMIERRVALFAHLHVNKDAASEIYRLPIQPGGCLAFT
jgi:hypothetical protein